MDPMKQIYLLLICQGFYLGSLCQEWTYPTIITAPIGSCVEIPCTYHPDGRSGASSTVWYCVTNGPDLEILNTKDPSTVIEEYRDRTSLVPGDNSCTLRIDPVRREDGGYYYYPGIAEDRRITAYDKQKIFLLTVTDRVNIQLYVPKPLTEGEAATIRCTVEHTCRSSPPSLQWNKLGQVQYQSVEISGGSWRQESNLTFIPSYLDDGTTIQCTATYPNGQIFLELGTLNIISTKNNPCMTPTIQFCQSQTPRSIKHKASLFCLRPRGYSHEATMNSIWLADPDKETTMNSRWLAGPDNETTMSFRWLAGPDNEDTMNSRWLSGCDSDSETTINSRWLACPDNDATMNSRWLAGPDYETTMTSIWLADPDKETTMNSRWLAGPDNETTMSLKAPSH
ncbi:uncharacterized protein LOC142255722 [Anomaloglossus baeobatrachus]|uniref:uncharacterized protein LOC142255722 n=1 Tax=Anomaloglossus baeobatrachus TaxID=238106 RepID=UPI003F4F813C